MVDITVEQLVLEVRKLADENPEFIYSPGVDFNGDPNHNCLYNPSNEQPGCIFGQAFINLGNPVPEDLEGVYINDILDGFAIGTELEVRKWLQSVQINQDDGKPWGICIETADDDM
jgi:hypothetical protein